MDFDYSPKLFYRSSYRSLVCTVSPEICNLLEMCSCCTKQKWNYESLTKYIIFNLPTTFPYNSLLVLETNYISEMKELKYHYGNNRIYYLKKRVQLWNVSKWDFREETKVTFATGELSFNSVMNTDKEKRIPKIGFYLE